MLGESISLEAAFRNLRTAVDMKIQLYKIIDSRYVLNPVGAETKSALKERIANVFVDRWATVEYDPNIGGLTLNQVVASVSPTSVLKTAPKSTKDANKTVDANVSGIDSETLRKIADSLFSNASDAYATYMDLERAKLQNKPVKLPDQIVVDYDIPRDYTWAWVIGGIAVVGLAAFALTKPRQRRMALPAHSGPMIDVTATRLG